MGIGREKHETRRLLYVAITRAQRALHVTWARQRTFGERSMSREPSIYLDAIERAGRGGARAEPSRRSARPRRTQRSQPASDAPSDVLDGALDPFMAAALSQRVTGETVEVEDVD